MKELSNMRQLPDRHPEHGGLARIDRRSRWGNPFRMKATRGNHRQQQMSADRLREAGVDNGWIERAWPRWHCNRVYSTELHPIGHRNVVIRDILRESGWTPWRMWQFAMISHAFSLRRNSRVRRSTLAMLTQSA